MTIEELRTKRLELGISQTFIAESIGVNRSYLCQCEKNIRNASKSLLIAYEAVLIECEKVKEHMHFIKGFTKKM